METYCCLTTLYPYYDVNKTNGAAEQSRPGLTDSDTFLCLVELFVFFPHGESVDVLLRFLI